MQAERIRKQCTLIHNRRDANPKEGAGIWSLQEKYSTSLFY
jgi:hypothetical protein